jgi:DNA polymerase-3 subunit gamma/tau
MLLKALEEVAIAPNTMMAAEMAIIRLTHVSELPDPETLIRKLQSIPAPAKGQAPAQSGAATHSGPATRMQAPQPQVQRVQGGAAPALAYAAEPLTAYASFESVVNLIRSNRDMKLLVEIEGHLRLARYSPGRIEFEPTPTAPRDLAARLSQRLQSWTGHRWAVTLVNEGGAATILETRDAGKLALEAEASEHPLVQAVLAAFPGAKISAIRTAEALTAEAAVTALPEVEDEWDPFEND